MLNLDFLFYKIWVSVCVNINIVKINSSWPKINILLIYLFQFVRDNVRCDKSCRSFGGVSMSAVGFLRSYGDVPLEFAWPLIEFRGLAAEAEYRSGAQNHDTLFELHELPAEAEFVSGATNHDTLMQLRDLPAEAQYYSGATSHDTFGYPRDSPYIVPESGNGVITNYII